MQGKDEDDEEKEQDKNPNKDNISKNKEIESNRNKGKSRDEENGKDLDKNKSRERRNDKDVESKRKIKEKGINIIEYSTDKDDSREIGNLIDLEKTNDKDKATDIDFNKNMTKAQENGQLDLDKDKSRDTENGLDLDKYKEDRGIDVKKDKEKQKRSAQNIIGKEENWRVADIFKRKVESKAKGVGRHRDRPNGKTAHVPLLTPPRFGDKRYEEWYRRASDMSQFAGGYEDDDDFDGRDKLPKGGSESERAQWENQLEFLMSCIATSVGLGNVWRFAFVAYENGGGAFLIPYLVVLILIGKPMYFLECIIGQFSSRNSVRIWSLSPAMRGTGYAQCLCTFYIVSYYVSIISLCQYYLLVSCTKTLPWTWCRPEWINCLPSKPSFAYNESVIFDPVSSAELYFINIVLQQSDGLEGGLGAPIWYLTLSLLFSWTVIFFIVVQGVKSSGKASYFLAIFPYVIMIILLITTCTLPGAGTGILFFITPQWEKITELKVWYAATTQVFFSLSVGIGPIIMFSSYNGFKSKIYRDSTIVTTLDTMTSLLSGFTIFGILGNLAHALNTEIDNVVGSGGTGLAFISYPDAIAKTFQPHILSFLFFLMMTVLGFGSAVAFLSTINTVLLDAMPKARTMHISGVSCIIGFCSGLVYCTPEGQFLLTLVDHFGGTFLALFGCIAELIGIIWIYGLENFCLDLEYMLEMKVSIYWRFCWGIVTPVLMLTIFFYALLNFDGLLHGGYYRYPTLAYVCGYLLLFIGISLVPIFIIRSLFTEWTGKFIETTKKVFKCKDSWGPRSNVERNNWSSFKNDALMNRARFKASRIKHCWLSLTGGYRRNV